MQEIADDLHTRHGTKCEVIAGDLTNPGEPKKIFDETAGRGIDIDLLVNNAGFGWVGEVDDTDAEHMLKLLQVNVAALTDLTYRFLPAMLERRSGGIINVSSVAGFQPVAYMPVYSASKAFVLHFSEALWAEVRDRGVTVMALCPGTTETEFFDVAGVSGWLKKQSSHSPSQVVKAALKAFDRGRQHVVPGWKNYLVSLSPRLARRQEVVKYTLRYFRPSPKETSLPPPELPPAVEDADSAEPQEVSPDGSEVR